MRSRWFHTPVLHTPVEGYEKKASWLELFYDLIFVAAFIQLGNALSKHPDIPGFLAFAGLFVPLWISWTGFSFYMNRYTVDDFVHRVIVFVQMFAVGGMAVSAPHLLDGHHKGFAFAYAIAQLLVTVMYIRTWKQAADGRAYSKYWGGVFALAGIVWFISIFIEPPWTYAFWAIGVALVFASPFSKQSRALTERFPIDHEHLSERYGLLAIIVLGESFVKVLTGLGEEGAALGTFFQASVLLILTCCIWWIYFDDVAGSHIRQERFTPIIWLYAHLPLQIAITASGVAIKKVVMIHSLTEPMKAEYRRLFAGTIGLTILSVTISGHGGTYGQTIYARHTYYPEDVQPGHQFVDNTSELPDGRIMIDYGMFHDTEPQP
jgi:low temperature requirement protein LtrA